MSINGVRQLKRLTVRYCAWGGSSAGVREFLSKGLVRFAEANPEVEVVARAVKGNLHPHAVGEYVNGAVKQQSLRNLKGRAVEDVLARISDRSGRNMGSLRRWHAPRAGPQRSSQGEWTPHYFEGKKGGVPFASTTARQ